MWSVAACIQLKHHFERSRALHALQQGRQIVVIISPHRRESQTVVAMQQRLQPLGMSRLSCKRMRAAHVTILKRVGGAEASAFSARRDRSEEHTSELQSLMRISYAVFCLKKK